MINPYQPIDPASSEDSQDPSPLNHSIIDSDLDRDSLNQTQPHLAKVFGKWFLICSISAAPSFILGAMSTDEKYAGMIVGILIFVVGYTCLDFMTAQDPWRQVPVIRRTLKITYGTRIAASLSMAGTPLDMLCGIMSISFGSLIFGSIDGDQVSSFFGALFVTLIQGMILNAVLLVYGSIILSVQMLYKKWSTRTTGSHSH